MATTSESNVVATRPLFHEMIKLPSGNFTVELSLNIPVQDVEGKSLAVLLHPWSWLGGSMNDPVLQYFNDFLHHRSYHVLTYNSRGVGNSSGWPTFSGLQEVKDLEEIVQWSLSYVGNVRQVLLVGYSYGSLITSLHPVLPPPIKTAHILLSYPIDKRSFLTFFHSKDYALGLTSLVKNPLSNVLLVFGDGDQFTTIKNYQDWAEQVRQDSSHVQNGRGRVEVVKVDGASHFWDEHAAREMRKSVESWLEKW